jgi:acetyl-CoA acetyltransferase
VDEVLTLFRRAVDNDDAAAMRAGLELLFAGEGGLSASDEFDLRHEGYVMEMPQSGERITGRDRMRAMQESFPSPPSITINRVTGAGRTWFIEAVNDYGGGDTWHVLVVMELGPDGRMLRDTRYYAKDFEPPDWRAAFTDPR